MSSHCKTRQLFIDKCRQQYSWADGAVRGTQAAAQRHKRDLEVAFAEIDGLMAGLHYEDEASTTYSSPKSPARPSAQPSQTPFPDADVELPPDTYHNAYPYSTTISPDDLDDLISPASPVAAGKPDPAQQPKASQWAAIRNLKDETEFHHQRFQKIVAAMGNSELLKLRDSYPDSKSVRNKGLVIFKDILDGYQPRELREVFAFACLSYAISQLLFRSGRIDKSEILGGVRSWRDLISDQRERHAFSILALELWPEAKDHMHCIPIPDRTRRLSVALVGPGGVPATGCSEFAVTGGDLLLTGDSFIGTSTDLLPAANLLPLDIENMDPHLTDVFEYSPQPEIHDTLTNTHQQYNFSALSPRMNPAFSEDPPGADRLGLPPTHAELDQDRREVVFADPTEGEDSPHPTNTTADVKKIEDTSMFLVIFTFLLGFGELLSVLSGRTFSSREYKLYGTEKEDRKRFSRSARESFFQPRRDDPNFVPPTFLALLSTAQMFTKTGALQSIDEIEYYLCSVASVRTYGFCTTWT